MCSVQFANLYPYKTAHTFYSYENRLSHIFTLTC
nr:MAG TPA: hypothetical protein [Caudoviricetes sp.]